MNLEVVGLSFNIVGVVILFFFGFPQPSLEEGVGMAFEDGTVFEDGTSVKEINKKTRNKRKFYKLFSYSGLGLILFGFIFQLVAVITQSSLK